MLLTYLIQVDEVRQLLTSFEDNLGKRLPLPKAGPVGQARAARPGPIDQTTGAP